ncbi:leucine-rich repeat protein [Emticicia fontis]
MSELALRLIEQNKRTKDPFLDLGNCGLEYELPNELLECQWLKDINLGRTYFCTYKKRLTNSQNDGKKNKFSGNELSILKHLLQLGSLKLNGCQIQEIIGIETLTNLQILDISSNQIQDITRLHTLVNLQDLDISYNQIENLEGLKSLNSLNILNLKFNQIQNPTITDGLINLKELDISGNQITEFAGLESLIALEKLNLSHNQFHNIPELGKLTKLEELNLNDNSIYKISGLKALTSLKVLNLSENLIQELEGLYPLTNLQILNVGFNQIQEIKGLNSLKNLQILDIFGNEIRELKELEALTNLQVLEVGSNRIRKIERLESLINLHTLKISANNIQEIEGLKTLTFLKTLKLDSNKIKEIKGLEALTNLQQLTLGSNNIQEIKGLETLTNLQKLILSSNKIHEIKGLESLTQLKELILSANKVQEIKGLETLVLLQVLSLSENQIENISRLDILKEIQTLHLSGNQIQEMKGLEALVNLNSLNLSKNKIKEIKGLKDTTKLRFLDLSSNEIKQIAELETLTVLEDLNLSFNKISNITGLEKLIKLNELHLNNNEIQQLGGLNTLVNLKELDVSDNKIPKLEGLDCLRNLHSLNLRLNRIQKLEGLKELISLDSLELMGNQVQIIEGLEFFTSLKSLDISQNVIQKISGLETLSHLTKLKLDSNQIEEISGLEALTVLVNLELSNNQIQEISGLDTLISLEILNIDTNQIQEIQGIANLRNLKNLTLSHNKIQKIQGLEKLIVLEKLDLSYNQILEITGLEELQSLYNLSLSNNQLEKLSGLENLPSLEDLDLSENKIQDIQEVEKIVQYHLLYKIRLDRNQLPIPAEINENNFDELCSFIEDYKKGSTLKRFAKLLFLGDGCVGKTTLYKHLKYGVPPSDITPKVRTHGISLDIWERDLENLKVNIWDFGGQEIFHGTHRLFLGQRALYVLVWTKQTNKLCSQEEQHPINYWLDFIADFGKESTVLLVENIINNIFDDEELPDEKKLSELVKEFRLKKIRLIPTHYRIDCQNDSREIRKFKGILKEELYNLLEDYPIAEFPLNWLKVIEILEELRVDKKVIPFHTYIEICEKNDISDIKSFLTYLNRTGTVSYFQELHKDVIILQAEWILDALYEALRLTNNPLKSTSGKLSGDDFSKIWGNYIEEEKKLFKSFMIKSELMTKVYNSYNYNEKIQRAYQYLIPNLFPIRPSHYPNIWENKDYYWVIKFQFIYPALMQRLQVNILNLCHFEEEEDLFKNYLAFTGKQNQICHIELLEEVKEMRIWTDTTDFYTEIVNLINVIYPLDRVEVVERIKDKKDRKIEFEQNKEKRKYQIKEPILTEITMTAKNPIKVFVTYCWVDKDGNIDETHQLQVHQLVNSLRGQGFDASFDKAINDERTSTDFRRMMLEYIYKSDKVIIVLSEGYANRANDFERGVGIEYQIISKDIDINENKYIFISFSNRDVQVHPMAFREKDTIYLSNLDTNEIQRLKKKLDGSPSIVLAPIGERVETNKPKDVGKLF